MTCMTNPISKLNLEFLPQDGNILFLQCCVTFHVVGTVDNGQNPKAKSPIFILFTYIHLYLSNLILNSVLCSKQVRHKYGLWNRQAKKVTFF